MYGELQEVQRHGRNRETVINHSYIDSGEYRGKFDKISDDKHLNRKLYQLAKKMLKHRSGTLFEDMYWLDINTLKVVAAETNSAFKNEYQMCIVCCHDGKIYIYNSKKHIVEFFYKSTISKYRKKGFDDFESQIKALSEFQSNGDIFMKEV